VARCPPEPPPGQQVAEHTAADDRASMGEHQEHGAAHRPARRSLRIWLQAVYARRRAARRARRVAWNREMAPVLGKLPELTMNEEEPCR
jgi:hypothetical protein